MAARENMLSLSAAFTEGARAEGKIALRKLKNQAPVASAHSPSYSQLRAEIAAKAVKSSDTPAYVMQHVMSAGDKYRAARLNGQPTPILGSAAATADTAATAAAAAAVNSSSVPIPLFLLLGVGVGTALFVGDYNLSDLATMLGMQKAVADASTFTAATAAHAHAGVDGVVGDVSHAPHTHRVQEQQPVWLQRSRRL